MTKYKLIAFDADDTLWDCQSHFVNIEEKYASLLSDYGIAPDEVKKNLFATECANMPLLGFGVKAFMLSLIECQPNDGRQNRWQGYRPNNGTWQTAPHLRP